MEEAVTESIIRQANQTFGQIYDLAAGNTGTQGSAEKENEDTNGIVNVETFVNNEKFRMQHHPHPTEQIDAEKNISKATPVKD